MNPLRCQLSEPFFERGNWFVKVIDPGKSSDCAEQRWRIETLANRVLWNVPSRLIPDGRDDDKAAFELFEEIKRVVDGVATGNGMPRPTYCERIKTEQERHEYVESLNQLVNGMAAFLSDIRNCLHGLGKDFSSGFYPQCEFCEVRFLSESEDSFQYCSRECKVNGEIKIKNTRKKFACLVCDKVTDMTNAFSRDVSIFPHVAILKIEDLINCRICSVDCASEVPQMLRVDGRTGQLPAHAMKIEWPQRAGSGSFCPLCHELIDYSAYSLKREFDLPVAEYIHGRGGETRARIFCSKKCVDELVVGKCGICAKEMRSLDPRDFCGRKCEAEFEASKKAAGSRVKKKYDPSTFSKGVSDGLQGEELRRYGQGASGGRGGGVAESG